VLDHLIYDYGSIQRSYYLMDADCYPAPLAPETLRVHSGIDEFPLAGPVVSDRFVAVNVATFHTIRSDHVRLHASQATVDVAGVEGGVEFG